jgi:hypothetical protein
MLYLMELKALEELLFEQLGILKKSPTLCQYPPPKESESLFEPPQS